MPIITTSIEARTKEDWLNALEKISESPLIMKSETSSWFANYNPTSTTFDSASRGPSGAWICLHIATTNLPFQSRAMTPNPTKCNSANIAPSTLNFKDGVGGGLHLITCWTDSWATSNKSTAVQYSSRYCVAHWRSIFPSLCVLPYQISFLLPHITHAQVNIISMFFGEHFSSIIKHHNISLKEISWSNTLGKTSFNEDHNSLAQVHFYKKWIESSASTLHPSHVSTCKTFLLTKLVFNGRMSWQALQVKCLILWGTLICHMHFQKLLSWLPSDDEPVDLAKDI